MAAPGSKLQPTVASSQESVRALLLMQKTALVGELAQAMANQFNNIMMAVTGYAELELKKAPTKDRRALEHIIANAARATALIQKLLDFSRTHEPSPQPLDPDAVTNEISPLIRELVGDRADLVLSLDGKSIVTYADRSDVEQILLALVLIARDSMPSPGQLLLSTSHVELGRESIVDEDTTEAGKYLLLSIETDTPPAADGANRDQARMSLETVRAFVKNLHGLVRFSAEGEAAAFKVYLPAQAAKAVEEPHPAVAANPAAAKTILVVEDDDAVRVPAAEFLMMEGFKVLQARTGIEALNVIQQSRSSLDILIADIFMPKMNGHEVAAKLLNEYPDLKVLYMSGDPGRLASPRAQKAPPNATLRKPFRLNTLRDKIRDLLGE